MSAPATALRTVLAKRSIRPRGGLVLCLHEISDRKDPGCCSFEEAMAFVSRAVDSGRVARRLPELEAICLEDGGLPSFSVIFDDGYASCEPLIEQLLARGVHTSIAVVGGCVDGTEMHGLLSDQQFSRRRLVELWGQGVNLIPHGMSHRRLDQMERAEMEEEIAASIAVVEDLTGSSVERFVLPEGRTSELVSEALSDHEVSFSYGTREGALSPRSMHLNLPRFCLTHDAPTDEVEFALSGWYERLHGVKALIG